MSVPLGIQDRQPHGGSVDRLGVGHSKAKRVACVGECLIEFNGTPFSTSIRQTFGGDSLNTAVYLARLLPQAIDVLYLTALGTDALSEKILRNWEAERIDTSAVLRDSSRLPGLYWIQVDETGERSFLYWRGESAARYLIRHREFDRVAAELATSDLIYLSGISLAILPAEDRETLLHLLVQLAEQGTAIVTDNNYRPALWASVDVARAALTRLLPYTHLLFVTFEDEQCVWGDVNPDATLARLHSAGATTAVVKLGAAGCLYSDGEETLRVATAPVTSVVDTTAAGDAFNAAFLAAWLIGCSPAECCRCGNALAGIVIQHTGAVISSRATPSLFELLAQCTPDVIVP